VCLGFDFSGASYATGTISGDAYCFLRSSSKYGFSFLFTNLLCEMQLIEAVRKAFFKFCKPNKILLVF
jgi:hypothetical protein